MSRVGGGTGGERRPDGPIPAAEYLLALVWFRRQTSRAGNEYLRCRFVVCAGPMKGRGFFCPWSLDTSKPGCRRRWELWLEQVGCAEEIDLDNDQEIARVFKGQAFKAEVSLQERNGYTNNDIRRLIYPRLYGPLDVREIETWNTGWKAQSWAGEDPGRDPGPTGDDRPPPPSEPQWSEGSSFRDDDDDGIPF